MLERNLCALLSEGFDDIVVCYSGYEGEVEQYLETRGKELVQSRNAALELIREEQPLGTIGGASRLKTRSGPLLVVNVDNLTTMRLRNLVARHVDAQAVLTIAVHREPFQIPFGEVTLRDGEVVGYAEKPILPITISSGTYVLSAECRRMIPEKRRFDIPTLFSMVKGMKNKVVAFEHSAAWIDVNDAAAVKRAEHLILDNYADFELWKISPDAEVTDLFLHDGFRISHAAVETCQGHIPKFVAAFDEVGLPRGRLIRHKVCMLPIGVLRTRGESQVWIRLDENGQMLNRTMKRSLAVLRHNL